MNIRIGCTGWSYEDWRGVFYPPNAPSSEWLGRYSQVFDYTEVDSSFYGPPRAETTKKWVQATPGAFRFSLKVPSVITHEKRLRDCDEDLAEFLAGIEPLRAAGRLAPLLLQLPPSFTAQRDGVALEAFLRAWPRALRLAVEFRDPGWWSPQTEGLLSEHAMALAWAVTQFAPPPPTQTTDFLYLRFVGDRELTRFHAIQRDLAPLIQEWKHHVSTREDANEAYVVVNNHFMGFAPATARVAAQVFGVAPPVLERAMRPRHQAALGEF